MNKFLSVLFVSVLTFALAGCTTPTTDDTVDVDATPAESNVSPEIHVEDVTPDADTTTEEATTADTTEEAAE